MNEQDLDKEYIKFTEKWADKIHEFSEDFNKLSSENKAKFQKFFAQTMPAGIVNISKFLSTKF